MARTNIYETDSDGRYLVGWYDPDQCESWAANTRWDGNNHVCLVTGDPHEWERLYRTPGGRWVLHHWSRWQGHPDEHRFVTDEEARDWLLRNETPVAEAERGPGQPRIGTPIKVTLPDGYIAALDGWVAEGRAASRSDAVRQAVGRGLAG